MIEKISQEEMRKITGGGPGCWIGKMLAKFVYIASCNPSGAARVCYEIIKDK